MFQWTTHRGTPTAAALERTKRARSMNYNSVQDRFDRDQQFAMRMQQQGYDRIGCGAIGEAAARLVHEPIGGHRTHAQIAKRDRQVSIVRGETGRQKTLSIEQPARLPAEAKIQPADAGS